MLLSEIAGVSLVCSSFFFSPAVLLFGQLLMPSRIATRIAKTILPDYTLVLQIISTSTVHWSNVFD